MSLRDDIHLLIRRHTSPYWVGLKCQITMCRAGTRAEDPVGQPKRPWQTAGHDPRRHPRPTRHDPPPPALGSLPVPEDAYAAAGVSIASSDAGVRALVDVLRTIDSGRPSRSLLR